ncbi:MAG: phenylalanine--tRNA ligase subunit alpha [Alphaproteobacteria bacterium]|nr:phenylalanine--tRNA ligase subunit alpha [Alphaproteobacteria bacterium]
MNDSILSGQLIEQFAVFVARITAATSTEELEALRLEALGKSGFYTRLKKELGKIADIEERKKSGQRFNEDAARIENELKIKKEELAKKEMEVRLRTETVDVTLPARLAPQGKIHPVTQVIEEITALLSDLGFVVAEGPDIEDDEHNFDKLNIPASHPARQMHDTFYLQGNGAGKTLLRTHTSPVQIRTMRAGKPPFRFIAPGSTYRCDSDITHTPMFHQIEGFVIDKNIHMGHLKSTINEFLKAFFELDEVPTRFRPSFFPFTEPSAEVDIGCSRANGELKIGAGQDWLEVMGCGMVHANVLKNCGIDPNEWQGFAFGMGVERLAMLKYGIPDLRTFFDSDARWLQHYGFDPLNIPNLVSGL